MTQEPRWLLACGPRIPMASSSLVSSCHKGNRVWRRHTCLPKSPGPEITHNMHLVPQTIYFKGCWEMLFILCALPRPNHSVRKERWRWTLPFWFICFRVNHPKRQITDKKLCAFFHPFYPLLSLFSYSLRLFLYITSSQTPLNSTFSLVTTRR